MIKSGHLNRRGNCGVLNLHLESTTEVRTGQISTVQQEEQSLIKNTSNSPQTANSITIDRSIVNQNNQPNIMQVMGDNVVVMDLAAGNVDGILGVKRKKLTGDERLRRNRERNRMHARKTRERKKLQSQVLQTRINELHAGKG